MKIIVHSPLSVARNFVSVCFVSVCSFSAFAALERTDFVSDETGNTNRWELSETTADDRGRKFEDGGESIASPLYGGAVVSFSLTAKMFGSEIAGSGSALVVAARPSDDDAWSDVYTLTFTGGTETNVTVKLARSDGYRRFRLTFRKGNGTLRVKSFAATWRAEGEVAVPADPAVRDVTENAFTATWTVDEPVDGFLFDCWTVSESPWTGETLWSESFDRIANATKSAKSLPGDALDEVADRTGWRGEWVYAPPGSSGVLQLGKASDEIGFLTTPALPALDDAQLVVRARAHTLQPDHVLPVFRIRGGETNELAAFELTAAFGDCHCGLGRVAEGDRLLFRSFSLGEQRKVLIDSVALVAGYQPGVPVTNVVRVAESVPYAATAEYPIDGLSPGTEYAFSVRSMSGGNVSDASPVCTVTTAAAADDDPETDSEDSSAFTAAVAGETRTSFSLSWTALTDAASYRVFVWTNAVTGASPGTGVRLETFSKAPASTATQAIASDTEFGEEYADGAGWSIISNVYPSVDAGTVRLGNTSNPGALRLAADAAWSGMTLRMTARRQTTDEGTHLSVARYTAAGDVLQIGDAAEIGVDGKTVCRWTLPALSEGDGLLFRSVSGKKSYRTILDEIEILDGYAAGVSTPAFAVEGVSVPTNGVSFAGLSPAVWTYAVEALDGSGSVLAAVTNVVDLVTPRAFAVSLAGLTFGRGTRTYRQSFSSFADLFPGEGNKAVWENYRTLPSWQAYFGGEPVDELKRNPGTAAVKGLYAFATGDSPETYALGTLTAEEAEPFIYGVSFRNDTPTDIAGVSLSYDGVQVGFKNPSPQELFCEFRVTATPEPLTAGTDWRTSDALTFRTEQDASSGFAAGTDRVTVPVGAADIDVRIPPGGYLHLRWRREAVANAAAMAVDDVTVMFEMDRAALTLIVR